MRNSGYRVIALTAAIGAAAAVLALTTHRDSATDVAPAPGAPVACAGTGVADPGSTPATNAGAATSGATPSWPAGSIVITGSTGDGVTVLDPTGAARQDIHETDPVTVLVPAAGTGARRQHPARRPDHRAGRRRRPGRRHHSPVDDRGQPDPGCRRR